MKITRIRAYRVELPLHEGSYKWSGGKSVTVFDSTVVAVETDAGLTGYGEVCPLGPFYLPAYADGRPRRHRASWGRTCSARTRASCGKLNRRMDAALQGPPLRQVRRSTWPAGTSSARRRASRSARCSAAAYGDDFVLYRAISQESPEAMAGKVAGYRAEGYRRFQLKVGGDPDVDIARIRAVRADARARRPADRRRQHRLADARRAARRARGARRRRLHRAALPELRGVPVGPPAHRPPVRARRGDRRHRRAAARPRRPGDGRGQPQDQQVRRPDARPARPATCASRWASP